MQLFDRVKEQTTSTGTGNITLAGAATGYRTFASTTGAGQETYYCIADRSGANWEVGTGTLVSATILSRDTVHSSSNAGALVNFTAGTKYVFSGLPADFTPSLANENDWTEQQNFANINALAVSASLIAGNVVASNAFQGNGADITDINASNINAGVLSPLYGGAGGEHVLYVDPSGDDATGVPYATLMEARNDAVSGDTIFVHPGTYTLAVGNHQLGKDFVNWHFEPGAIIQVTGSPSGQIANAYTGFFDDSSVGTGLNAPLRCVVTGGADFIFNMNSSGNQGKRGMVRITNASSDVRIQCNKIDLADNNPNNFQYFYNLAQEAGNLYVHCNSMFNETYGTIWWKDGNMFVECANIIGGYINGSGVHFPQDAIIAELPATTPTGSLWVRTEYMFGNTRISGSNTGTVWIDALEIEGTIGVNGGKCYVRAQKILAQSPSHCVSTSGTGQLWVDVDKLTVTPYTSSATTAYGYLNLSGSLSVIDSRQFEDTGFSNDGNDDWDGYCNSISGSGNHYVNCDLMEFGTGITGGGYAWDISGTATLHWTGRISATATNFGGFQMSGGTLRYLGGSLNLTGTASAFTASSARNVNMQGVCVSNKDKHANITLLDNKAGFIYSGGSLPYVTSVSNSDTSLIVTPTVGDVIASLNLAKENIWLAKQRIKVASGNALEVLDSGNDPVAYITFEGDVQANTVSALGMTANIIDASGGGFVGPGSNITNISATNIASGILAVAQGGTGQGTAIPTSVTNSNGTLTISPTTGTVVASLNLANANTWTGQQIFNSAGATIIRQTGGVAGTDEIQISHNGTDGIIESKDGKIRLVGSQVIIPDGASASSPGIAFTTNTDLGIYRSGANQMRFVSNSADVFMITQTTLQITAGAGLVWGSIGVGSDDVGLRRKSAGVLALQGSSSSTAGALSVPTPASGAGLDLALSGSSAASGNTNGGNVTLTPGAKSGSGLDGKVVIRGATAGPGANLLEVHNSASTPLLGIDPGGRIWMGNNTSATAGDYIYCIAAQSALAGFMKNTQASGFAEWRAENSTSGHNASFRSYGASAAGSLLGQTVADKCYMIANNMPMVIGTGDPHALYFGTNNATRMTIASAGGVTMTGSVGAAGYSSPAITPSTITADQNNYSPTAGAFLRLSSDASRNITGMVAGVDGEERKIWNVGSNNIVLQHANGSSTTANQFLTSTGADITLSANKCALAMYDLTSTRWRVTLLP